MGRAQGGGGREAILAGRARAAASDLIRAVLGDRHGVAIERHTSERRVSHKASCCSNHNGKGKRDVAREILKL